jgi:hypothetical protein
MKIELSTNDLDLLNMIMVDAIGRLHESIMGEMTKENPNQKLIDFWNAKIKEYQQFEQKVSEQTMAPSSSG